MKKILLFLALLPSASFLQAEAWSLDSCINYAIEHNISVKTSNLEKYSAELSVTEAKDAFLPQAQAEISQSFNIGRGLTAENTYANRNTSQTGWNVGVSLPLFQGLSATRRLTYSRAYLKAVAEQYEASKDNVELQVIAQYLQVLYCGEVLDVARERERLAVVQQQRTAVLVSEGKVPELELTQADAQVAQDHLSVVNAENDRVLALLDLSQLLQLPSMEGFDIQTLANSTDSYLTSNEVFTAALQSNHSLRAGRLEIEAADKNIDLAKTGYIPRLSFNAGVGSSYYHIGGMSNAPFHRQMRDNFNTYFGFSLSVPLFDAFSTRNSVRRAELAKNQAILRYDDARSNLYKAINQAAQQSLAARSRHEAAVVAENATKAALEAMDVKYEFGRANATELEQARSEYIQARLATVQAKYETILRERILAFYNRP
ncbi:MAG: TolC family protein [Firmicutes bacterium]|nr:TolC family protein [Bacillota bacterium]MCM1402078.1 TolC family protein [Bacteroides sp.]MCM1478001.1 TolC family protein [Bacteroides sp.]